MALQSVLKRIYEAFAANPDKMLIKTSVIGWGLSTLAQIAAIVTNDKVSKEQKMFMVPQELADGVVNILSFLLVTKTFTSVANKLVNQGKWVEKPVWDFLKKNNLTSRIGKPDFNVLKHANLPENLERGFLRWRAGVSVGGTLVGSVLSCNILTPLLRNVFASNSQKNSIAKLNDKNNRANSEFTNTYFRPTMATFRGQVSIYPTRGSLKI